MPSIFKSKRRLTAQPVPLAKSEIRTTDVPRLYPIDRLNCRLSGTLTITVAGTYTYYGLWNLIDRIEVILDGREVVLSAPGRALQMLTLMDIGYKGLDVGPSLAAPATLPFELSFVIAANPWTQDFSLLDATERAGHRSLEVRVTWANDAACFATGTIAVNVAATSLAIDAIEIGDGELGKPGGALAPYPRRLIDVRTQPITAAQADLDVPLLRNQSYGRIALMAETTNRVASNAVLNAVDFRIGTTILQRATAAMLRAEMMIRYGISSTDANFIGFYPLEIIDESRLDQLQAVVNGPDLTLTLDVSHPGTDQILIILDRYVFPRPR